MIISPEAFEKMAAAIAQQNDLPIETARQYANMIGDTPELAEDGRIVVRDQEDRELARVVLIASSPAV